MNETIKTYTKITPLDGLKMLVENDGEPVKGLAFTDLPPSKKERHWEIAPSLRFVATNYAQGIDHYDTSRGKRIYAAKVTTIDPCKAPEGCPELEPWLAYVGYESANMPFVFVPSYSTGEWIKVERSMALPCAIDVREEWAKEHFPEHCRIRAYVEPDAFEEFLKGTFIGWDESAVSLLRQAYELGQANPTKGNR